MMSCFDDICPHNIAATRLKFQEKQGSVSDVIEAVVTSEFFSGIHICITDQAQFKGGFCQNYILD